MGSRLRRFPTYVVAFLITGIPRFLVLAFGFPMSVVLAVAAVGGVASGFLNPILGAVIYERIPKPLMGRVTSLNAALCWSPMSRSVNLLCLGGLPFVSGCGARPAQAIVIWFRDRWSLLWQRRGRCVRCRLRPGSSAHPRRSWGKFRCWHHCQRQ